MKYAPPICQDADFERFWKNATDEDRAAPYAEFDAFAAVARDRRRREATLERKLPLLALEREDPVPPPVPPPGCRTTGSG